MTISSQRLPAVRPTLSTGAAPKTSQVPAQRLRLRGHRWMGKDVFDRVTALLLLLVLAPLLLLIAGAIKSTSSGPVLFRQRRAGLNGEYFRIWKFRTMQDGADRLDLDSEIALALADGRSKIEDDPRVTPLGRLLRATSLDELPQLLNVARGHMSLVGPRPVPADVESFPLHELRRLAVKPGMTGLWQVSGRSSLSWDERVALDLFYIDNRSPALDLQILARTLPALFSGRGAY